MFSEIAKIKTGGVKQPSQTPQNSLTMAEARANLENEFGDHHAVDRAFKMLGERAHITPQVRFAVSKPDTRWCTTLCYL